MKTSKNNPTRELGFLCEECEKKKERLISLLDQNERERKFIKKELEGLEKIPIASAGIGGRLVCQKCFIELK